MQNLIIQKGLVITTIIVLFSTIFVPISRASIVWDVTITCANSDGQYDYVVFGEATDAHDGPPVDSYDILKPPAPQAPYIRVWLDDNLPYPYNLLTMDYRSYPDSLKVWNLTIQWMPSSGSSPSTITVSWDTNEFSNCEYTSVGLYTDSGTLLQNMLANSTYVFSCPAYVPQYYNIIGSLNNPPVFGTPSPVNGSTHNPLSFTWGIPINDPEGDPFSWTIQCSNGQTNSGSGAANGSKSLGLTGLAYSTLYKIWVNATDPTGGGQYTRRWYTFTTKDSLPPVFGTPTPVNGSTNTPVSLSWSIPINDPEGDLFSWTIQCSNGQSTSGSTASNGTKSLSLSGLAYSTSYKVWVNATDPTGSGQYTRRWYTFTTKTNLPPVLGSPTPANNSVNQPLSMTWSIPITDPDGDSFTWSIQCSNGQSSGISGATNGTKSLSLSGLAYATIYKIWVNATDPIGSGMYIRRWFVFTTKSSLPPVFGIPSPSNGSTNLPLSFSWSIPISDPEGNSFTWSIQCSNGQTNGGSGASNGTKSLSLSGLAYSTSYKVWVNATDPGGSGQYTRRWYTFTTKDSLPPVFGTPTPVNGSTNTPVSLSWSIPISDPEGDLFSWTIQCSNGQSSTGANAVNGTKNLVLSGLAYSMSYKVWVNATDPTGSGQYTRRWYTFTTKANLPPVFGTPTPVNGSAYQQLSFMWNIPMSDPEGDLFSWSIQCSNGQVNSGSGASNGTKSLSLSGLAYLTTYKVWVNATDSTGSGQYTRRWYTFTTKAFNNPPVFGTPSPVNGSTNTLLSFTWSIPINDLEGNVFTWSIQCSNGQTNSGANAANGTKSLSVSGLAYFTTYTVWVNATDPAGSGQYMRSWYIFTTQQQNLPPYTPSNPTPSSGAINVTLPVVLTWVGGDPNAGDTVSYDVYFGTSSAPSLLVHNQTNLSYAPGGMGYSTLYYWKIVSWDSHDVSTVGPVWHFTTSSIPNSPPNTPSSPLPVNGTLTASLTSDLSWSGGDPDGDTVFYDVYFGTSSSPSIVSHNQSTSSYDLGTLAYSTTYYWRIVSWDSHGSTTQGPLWHFTTKQQSTGGGGGNGGGGEEPPENPPNSAPVADASAGEPYQGYINTAILFNGSRSYDPDGNITTWYWTFGDDTNGTGRIITHTYTQKGTYNVTLMVTDDDGATNTNTTVCVVSQPNQPPTQPLITGPVNGTKNTLYMYSAVSTDADNDTIQYTFDWGDGLIQPSPFLPSETSFGVNHSWAAAGRYRFTVTASDNQTTTQSEYIVYIDAIPVDEIGYLLDNNSDGIYDAYYSDELQQILPVQNTGDQYTIDRNGDGAWDATYSTSKGLGSYQAPLQTYGLEIIIPIIVIAIYLIWRRNAKKNK